MVSITVDIQDSQFQKLKTLAEAQGLSPEELLRVSIGTLTSEQEDNFKTASDYVLKKNRELYRRLA